MANKPPWLRPVDASSADSPMLETALAYAAQGLAVHPVHSMRAGCCTCGDPACEHAAKHPLTQHGVHDATTQEAAIRRWWEQWPFANVALRAAEIGAVLDIDPRNGGTESLDSLIAKHGELPDTVEVQTGGGGLHFWFRLPAGIDLRKGSIAPGVDLQVGAGAYVLAPPSLHKSGRGYDFEASSDFLLGQAIAMAPDWLIQARREAGVYAPKSRQEHPGYFDGPALEVERTRAALAVLDPDMPYPEWLRVGQALHQSCWSQGFDLWDAWSTNGAKYCGRAKLWRKWNSFDTSGSAKGRVSISTIFFMARAAAAAERPQAPSAPSAAPASAPILRIVSAAAWGSIREPPPREWLWDQWVPMAQTTALYGDGGVGKTLAAQQLMTAVATGQPLFGHRVRRGIALGIFCEDDEAELHRRQAAINDCMHIDYADVADVHVVARAGEDNLLMTFLNDVGTLTPFWHQLRELVDSMRPTLLVVDTAADTFGGNENIRPQVRQYVQGALTKLAIEYRCAVLLCAHPSAAGLQSGQGTGGSTAWNNSVRSRLYLFRDPYTERLALERKKSNYAKAGERVEMLWTNGAFRQWQDIFGDSGDPSQDREYDQLFIALLREFTAAGKRVSDALKGSRYAPREFARVCRERHMERSDLLLGVAMRRLLERGDLVIETDDRNRTRWLAEHPRMFRGSCGT